MSWSDDPELQQMFVDEVSERSVRLVEGARALRAGTVTAQDAGDLLREGHTIKGTGRVMGYEDVASAGLMLEMLWRWIQHGDIEPAPIFGRALEALSAAIPVALDDPGVLVESMAAIHEFFEGSTLPEELPAVPAVQAVSAAPVEIEEDPAPAFEVRIEPAPSPAEPVLDADPVIIADVGTDEAPTIVSEPSDSAAGAESATEDPPPMSAQEAFAALKRSMQGEAVDPVVSSESDLTDRESHPVDESTGTDEPEPIARAVPVRDAPVREAPVHLDDDAGEPAVEATAPTIDVDAVDREPIEDVPVGSVIEFPLPEAAAEAEPAVEEETAFHEAEQPLPSDHRTDVVVLPSKAKREAPAPFEPGDLGGLIGAVQSWAAEEAISVNAGRLYGLVDHIVSLRMDIDAVKDQLVELAQVAAADPFFSERISEIAEGIDPILQTSEGIESRALGLAAAPLRDVTNTLPQLGRYLSRKTGKELRIELVGDDVLVDRKVLERLGDAVRQLVVNAAVHGIEDSETRLGAGKPGTGAIRIEANRSDVNLEVSVIDDGRGIDWHAISDKGTALGLLDEDAGMSPEALRSLLYRSGFSTRESQDELAGDGEGLAVVRDAMESMNGTLTLQSTPGERTAVTMVVPTHQAMQKALLVVAGGIVWGIPETSVLDVIDMNKAVIAVTAEATVLDRGDESVPFASFADLMGLASEGVPSSVVVVASSIGSVALGVENVVGVRRVAAKELGAVLSDADAITGAALLGGSEVVLLVDTTRLAERQHEVAADGPAFAPARVLIVDDSRGVQQVVSSALATSGFNTAVAGSVADALGALQSGTFEGLVVDFSMPRADGVALTHMVRQRHGDLPIVMLSGVAEGEDIDRAREAGVDAFFGKDDFREGGLAEKLRELISARRAREQTA